MTESIVLRRMEASDLPAAAELERTSGDARWTLEQWAAELAKPLGRYFVATTDFGRVIGMTGGWIVGPELQVANIVIHPDFQCRGIGRQLLEKLIAQAAENGCREAALEVRRANRHAQALYRAVGFQETGHRPGFYQNPTDDAILMEKKW
jgi:ribosomal-protein-alanine N-acetyltransferase